MVVLYARDCLCMCVCVCVRLSVRLRVPMCLLYNSSCPSTVVSKEAGQEKLPVKKKTSSAAKKPRIQQQVKRPRDHEGMSLPPTGLSHEKSVRGAGREASTSKLPSKKVRANKKYVSQCMLWSLMHLSQALMLFPQPLNALVPDFIALALDRNPHCSELNSTYPML